MLIHLITRNLSIWNIYLNNFFSKFQNFTKINRFDQGFYNKPVQQEYGKQQ